MNKFLDLYPNFSIFKQKLNAFQPDLIADSDANFYAYISAFFEKYTFLSNSESVNNASVFKIFSQFKLVFIKVLQEQKKSIKDLIISSSDSISQSSDESIEEEDAEKFIQGGGSNKMLPSVLSVIGSLIRLPNVFEILERKMKVVFSPVDSDQRKSPTFYRLGDEAVILDALSKGADKLILNKLDTADFLNSLEKKIQENIKLNPDKFKGEKGDDGLMSASQVNTLILNQLNIQANHPISAAEKTQLFNDITTVNSSLSNKVDSVTLFFQDGLNRKLFLDSMKQFFFQRGVLVNDELEFFYQPSKQSPKTAFFQIKVYPKREIYFDQQTTFNLIPKVGNQTLLTSANINQQIEHLYHLIGWHAIFDDHYGQYEIDNSVRKHNQGLILYYDKPEKSVDLITPLDWLHDEGDYALEYFFEFEKSNKEVNLNTLSLKINSLTTVSGWKYAWFYVGMSTWGNWANASGAAVGAGWMKFDQETTFHLKLKITMSKNQDNTRNYLFVFTAQNQKSDNFVKFRAKKYLQNVTLANFIKEISLKMDGGNSNNQFQKPKHLNIKVLEQIHH